MPWTRFLRIALITDPLATVEVVLMGFTTAMAHFVDRRGVLGFRVAAFWARALLFTSGVRVDAAGQERVPRDRGVVFVVNHRSMMDVPVLMACLPVHFRFLAKESLFRVPFIGWNLSLGGHVRVDREDKRSAARALAQARRIIQAGTSVVVFAEGSRSEGGMRRFKGGAAHLAIRSGAPVVPVGLAGTRDALPRGSIHIRPARVQARVGVPMETAGMTAADSEELTRRVQDRVSELIA
jgi:1-acyl-sn-glycerol-3-phosphate acyltransferase